MLPGIYIEPNHLHTDIMLYYFASSFNEIHVRNLQCHITYGIETFCLISPNFGGFLKTLRFL